MTSRKGLCLCFVADTLIPLVPETFARLLASVKSLSWPTAHENKKPLVPRVTRWLLRVLSNAVFTSLKCRSRVQ